MSNYIYSPVQNMISALALKEEYEREGTWPGDAVELSDVMALEFMNGAPEGKRLAAGSNGFPEWVDMPPPTQDELLERAKSRKSLLMNEANSITQAWQTQLLLGIITDADKEALTLWMKYIQAVQAVDTSTAPGIDWPVKPE